MGRLRFTPDSIIETRPEGVLELGRWHAGLSRTWRANEPFAPTRAQVPSDPLLMPDGRFRPYAPDAEREILSDIPFAIRAVAAPFGDAQWLALEGMRHVDGFADFLRQELAGAGPNFVTCCWVVAQARWAGRARRLELAVRMMHTPRAALLTELTDITGIDDVVVRLLSRAAPGEACERLLLCLTGLAATPEGRRLLLAMPQISHDLTLALRLLPPWLQHPGIARALSEGGSKDGLRTLLDGAILFADEARRPAILRSLAGARRWDELARRLRLWSDRLRREAPFPPPPIPGIDQLLEPIRNGAELEAEGKHMRHCVADYEHEVRLGGLYYYRWLGAERATVELASSDPGTWHLNEHLGRGNATLSPATVGAIAQIVERQLAAMPPPDPHPLDIYVAGTAYHRARDVFDRLRVGQRLVLRREPANPYDRLAIEVLTEDGAKLGYVPQAHNRDPAARMDAGEAVEAWIVALNGPMDIRIRVARRIRMAA